MYQGISHPVTFRSCTLSSNRIDFKPSPVATPLSRIRVNLRILSFPVHFGMEEKPLQNPNGDSGLKPRVGPHRAYPGLRESSSNPGQTHQILDDSFFNAEGAPYQPWALPKAGMVPRRWRFGMSFRIAILMRLPCPLTPTGLWPACSPSVRPPATTRSGLIDHLFVPRIARCSQPWAGGHNPLGIDSQFSSRAMARASKAS